MGDGKRMGLRVSPGTKGTTWYARPYYEGKREYEKLGRDYGPDAIDEAEAWRRLEALQQRVDDGLYVPKKLREAQQPVLPVGEDDSVPLFRDFAEQQYERRCVTGGRMADGLTESGRRDLRWKLDRLLPTFGHMPLDQIKLPHIDTFIAEMRKPGDGQFAASSVNKFLATLESTLQTAVEYELITVNRVHGRRASGPKYNAVYLPAAAQIEAFLTACGERDLTRRGRQGHGRVLMMVLVMAGLRISEALELRWKDVQLGAGQLRVLGTKTARANRRVPLSAPLREGLSDLKALRGAGPEDRVFGTRTGKRDSPSNVLQRTLRPAVARANEMLIEQGEELIDDGLTNHGLRHTCISAKLFLGEEVVYLTQQIGHADPGFTYKRYAKLMRRNPGDQDRLRRLFEGDGETVAPVGSAGVEKPVALAA